MQKSGKTPPYVRILQVFLDEPLSAVIGRMRLAGDDQLHRPLRVQQEPLEPVLIPQHQREPLVRRDASREPAREDVGI